MIHARNWTAWIDWRGLKLSPRTFDFNWGFLFVCLRGDKSTKELSPDTSFTIMEVLL